MNVIIFKFSDVPGKVPLPSQLQLGEIALNSADGKLFFKTIAGAIITI
jgi:hypothetical protein